MARSPAAFGSSATSSGDLALEGAAIRTRILRIERLIDETLVEIGAFNGDLVEAGRSLGLAAVVGQPVFDALAGLTSKATDTRGVATQMHRLLDRVGKVLGYDEGSDYGDGGKDAFTRWSRGG